MGSLNPVILTESALSRRLAEIVDGLAACVASFGGQLCTKPGLVFFPAAEAGHRLCADLAVRLDAVAPEALLTASIHAEFQHAVAELDTTPGVQRLTREAEAAPSEGYWQRPVAHCIAAADLVSVQHVIRERFGPHVLLVSYASQAELHRLIAGLEGQLTAAVHAEPEDAEHVQRLLGQLSRISGRLVFNGFPTGVAIAHAQHHGGPFPATSTPAHTAVGAAAVRRFLRPVVFQDAPAHHLPPQLLDANPLGIWRRVDGALTRQPITEATHA
jgi:NADP-dependent aldehyde dehydrogenase